MSVNLQLFNNAWNDQVQGQQNDFLSQDQRSNKSSTLTLPTTMSDSLDSWLPGETTKTLNKSSSSPVLNNNEVNRTDNIMAPVLKETPNSHWLIDNKSDNLDGNNTAQERAANLTTSLWLASTSTSSLTCHTAATKNIIEWPTHLFANSIRDWLDRDNTTGNQNKLANDLHEWLLVTRSEESNSFGNEKSFASGLKEWLLSARDGDYQQRLIVGDSSSESANSVFDGWLQATTSSNTSIEKWFESAARDFESLDVRSSVEDDEDESIAILSCSDFDVVPEEEEEQMEFNEEFNIWLM